MENDSVENLQKTESSFKDMYSKLYGVPREDLEDVSIEELEQFETAFKKRANKVQFKKIQPANVSLRAEEKEVTPLKAPVTESNQPEMVKKPVENELNITTSTAAKSLPLSTDKDIVPVSEQPKIEKNVPMTEDKKTTVVQEQIKEKIIEPVREPSQENEEVETPKPQVKEEKILEQKIKEPVVVEPKKPEIPDITDLDKKLKLETAHLPEPPSIVEEPQKKELPKVAESIKPAEKNIDKMVDNLLEHPMHKAFQEPTKSIPVTDQTIQPKTEPVKTANIQPQSPVEPVRNAQPMTAVPEPPGTQSTSNLPLNNNLQSGEIDVIQKMIDNFKNINALKQETPTPQPTTQGLAGVSNETGAVTSNVFNVNQPPVIPGIASKFNIPVNQAPTEVTSPSEQTLKSINTNLDMVVKSITTVLKEIRISMEGVKGTVDQIAAMIPGIQGGSTINTQLAGKNNGLNAINSGMINNYKNEVRSQMGSNIIDIKNTRGSYPGFTI